jgi:hypothetical protein
MGCTLWVSAPCQGAQAKQLAQHCRPGTNPYNCNPPVELSGTYSSGLLCLCSSNPRCQDDDVSLGYPINPLDPQHFHSPPHTTYQA